MILLVLFFGFKNDMAILFFCVYTHFSIFFLFLEKCPIRNLIEFIDYIDHFHNRECFEIFF